MSIVFIVQNQLKRSPDNSGLIPRFDFRSAQPYGELQYLLGPSAGPFNSKSIIDELHEKLRDFTSDDFLVLVGNPCLLGWALAIAADANEGDVKLLQWGRGTYQVIEVKDLFRLDEAPSR